MVEIRGQEIKKLTNTETSEQPEIHEPPKQLIVVKMSWSKVVSRVLITLIIVCGILYIPAKMLGIIELPFHTAESISSSVADSLKSAERIAVAFQSGSIKSDFRDYVSTLSTGNNLQVTTLRTDESISRSESKSYLWGYVGGEATVELRFPVEYVYTIDLNDRWDITWHDETNEIFVQAPKIEFNTPSIDYSQLKKETRQGSIFINETRMHNEVKEMIMDELNQRAEKKIKIILEAARNETKKFFESFIENQIETSSTYKPNIVVTFANEVVTIPETESQTLTELEIKP
jgi:hypothetical protein